ncbi:hypothetical protein [Candidatus Pelagibacter bacterium nBUS_25]|uniref:hypothetical protein n=1 Tax=Candidatus Pelagibacter bacterium nBUS_25 TaxID=3374187 RepID=UPI003EC05E74
MNFQFKIELNYLLIFKIFFSIALLFSIYHIILKKKKFNYLDVCFVITYITISILTYDRYFLDEDEFAYWGQKLKSYYYFSEVKNLKFDYYHQPLLTSWQLLFSVYSDFSENIIIFSNNVILIGTFFYLVEDIFEDKKNKYIEILISFSIFYLLLNNLSFGFVSIYADPIIAALSACALKIIVHNKYDKENIILLFFLSFCIYFIHRLGIIFIILLYPYIALKNYKFFLKKNKINFIIASLFFGGFIQFLFFKQLTYSATAFELFDRMDILYEIFISFISDLHKLLFTNIYYSSFGTSINVILELILNKKNVINVYGINIIIWLLIVITILIIQNKKKLIIYFLISTIFYLLVIYIEKAYFQKLSFLVFGRYFSILLLTYLLFLSFYKKKIYVLILLLIFNVVITPLKSYGFFVPDNIYYAYEKNLKYLESRKKVKKFINDNLKCNGHKKEIFILYDKKNFPEYLSGHFSLILNILDFELSTSKTVFLDVEEFYLMKVEHIDFNNFFDCIYGINIKLDNQQRYLNFEKSIRKINL